MDSIRQDVVHLLEFVARSECPFQMGNNFTLTQISLARDLIAHDYLVGEVYEDEEGVPINAFIEGITLDGRAYADQQHQAILNRKPSTRMLRVVWALVKWTLITIGGAVVVAFVLKRLGLT